MTHNDRFMKIAVFPGSFDPITIGHVQIVKRALPLFDKIIIAVGVNSQKKYLYSLDERLEGIDRVFVNEPKVEVDSTPVVKKVEPKSPILVYTVQVGAYRNSNSGLSSVSNIQISKEASLYKYRLGTFQTYKDAKRFRNKSLNNYPDAFVQALIDGKPVPISKALNFK